MAAAVAIVVAVFAVACLLRWPDDPVHTAALARSRLAALAALAPAAALFLCIARLARHRFSTSEDIQGSASTQGTERARLLQALLQNTLEQAVLAIPVYFAAALVYPARLLPLIPAAAGLFLVGRFLFCVGYARGAPARAVGFGLTFYPGAALLVSAIAIGALRGIA